MNETDIVPYTPSALPDRSYAAPTTRTTLGGRLRNILREDSGTAMIEVAVIMPVIILMLLAALNFGVLLEQDMAVADSARAASQYASLQGMSTNMSAIQAVASSSAGSIPGYQVTAQATCTCQPGGAVVSCTSTCSSYGTPSEYVLVHATANLPLLFGLQGFPLSYAVQSWSGTRVVWSSQ